jgi:hypothetical protein
MRGVALVSIVAASSCSTFSEGSDTGGGSVDAAVDASTESSTTLDGGVPPVDASTFDAVAQGSLKVFVTGVGYADITTAATADTKCANEASGRLPGRFVAWYPNGTTGAPARLVTSGGTPVDGPWFRVDGARVAANRAALTNTASVPLENGIDVTATSTKNSTGGVWTGTRVDGGVGVTCPNFAPTTGTAGETGAAWTEQKFFTAACGTSLGLYCFQVE